MAIEFSRLSDVPQKKALYEKIDALPPKERLLVVSVLNAYDNGLLLARFMRMAGVGGEAPDLVETSQGEMINLLGKAYPEVQQAYIEYVNVMEARLEGPQLVEPAK